MQREHDGILFYIDTMDWHDSDDGEKCAHKIANYLSEMEQAKRAELHRDLLIEDQDPTKLMQEVMDQCDELALEVMKEELYVTEPSSGHNAFILAN